MGAATAEPESPAAGASGSKNGVAGAGGRAVGAAPSGSGSAHAEPESTAAASESSTVFVSGGALASGTRKAGAATAEAAAAAAAGSEAAASSAGTEAASVATATWGPTRLSWPSDATFCHDISKSGTSAADSLSQDAPVRSRENVWGAASAETEAAAQGCRPPPRREQSQRLPRRAHSQRLPRRDR